MTRPVRMQVARQKARGRRIALDVGREARDRRVEDAAAEVFTRLEERAEAEQAIAAANAAIGAALVSLAREGIGVEAAAELLELEVAEVRRLSRVAGSAAAGSGAAGSAPAVAAGGEDRDAGRWVE